MTEKERKKCYCDIPNEALLKGCRGCQIPLLAWCFWEEQWLSYTHSYTIWKGSSDRQTTSPRRQTSLLLQTLNHFYMSLLGMIYPCTTGNSHPAYNRIELRHWACPGLCQNLVLLVQRPFPECAVTTQRSRWWRPPTTSIHKRECGEVPRQHQCSEVIKASTLHLLTWHLPICTSQQYNLLPKTKAQTTKPVSPSES